MRRSRLSGEGWRKRGGRRGWAVVAVALIWLCALGVTGAVAQDALSAQFDAFYAYDAELPLDAEVTVVSDEETLRQEHIWYGSTHDERVPALLMLPKGGQAPYPCIVALEGLGMKKEDMVLLGALLAPEGIAMLAYDTQYQGERQHDDEGVLSLMLYRSRDALIQTVIDGRRAVDYLRSRPEIDAERIGVVGLSLGGILGGVLAGVEPRVKAAALLGAGGGWGEILSLSEHPAAKQLIAEGLDAERVGEVLAPVDPLGFVGRIPPRPLLFVNGTEDEIIPPATSRALQARAAAATTEVEWVAGGHTFSSAAWEILRNWVEKSL